MPSFLFLQGVAHVVGTVGTETGRARFDICVNLLDSLRHSKAPPEHKRGVHYACQVLLNSPLGDG